LEIWGLAVDRQQANKLSASKLLSDFSESHTRAGDTVAELAPAMTLTAVFRSSMECWESMMLS
jgi:hypothetical protein